MRTYRSVGMRLLQMPIGKICNGTHYHGMPDGKPEEYDDNNGSEKKKVI